MKPWTSFYFDSKGRRNFHFAFAGFLLSSLFGSILYAWKPTYPIWNHPFLMQGMGISFESFSMPHFMLQLSVIPMLWVILIAIAGTSLLGMPIACGLWILRACAFGCTMTKLYAMQGIWGMRTAVILLIPYAAASTIVYYIAVWEASRFSLSLVRILRNAEKPPTNHRMYLLRFLALLLGMGLVGILQCIWVKYMYCNDIG